MSPLAATTNFDRVPVWIVELLMTHCDNHYTLNGITNGITRSEEFDHADWVKTATTVTPDAAVDPLGTTTADKLDDISAVTVGSVIQLGIVPALGNTFTFSIWLRGDTVHDCTIGVDAVGETSRITFKVGLTWKRYIHTYTFIAGATGNAGASIRQVGQVAADTGYVYAWGAQFEQNSFATTYGKTVAVRGTLTSICAASDDGDGKRCSYSVPTCQDLPNFKVTGSGPDAGIRRFRFSETGKPIPLAGQGFLPYVKTVSHIAQKIDAGRNVTTAERVQVIFNDDTVDTGFHNDKLPGLVNTSTAGTFWRRFREIYRNYSGRTLRVLRGYAGEGYTLAQFDGEEVFSGKITNIKINNNGTCEIEAVDKLSDIQKKIPSAISDDNTVRVANVFNAILDVEDASEFTDPANLSVNAEVIIEVNYDATTDLQGVLTFTEGSTVVLGVGTDFNADIGADTTRIKLETDDEIHYSGVQSVSGAGALTLYQPYTGRGGSGRATKIDSDFRKVTAVDLVNNQLTTALFYYTTPDSSGESYTVGMKIREVIWLATEVNKRDADPTNDEVNALNVLDALLVVLRRAGVPEADIDVAGIQAERDKWLSGANAVMVKRLIADEINTKELIQELSEIGLFSVFVNSSNLITAKVYAPSIPGVTLIDYGDAGHFIEGSLTVDDEDEETRITRATIAWDQNSEGEDDSPEGYHRVHVGIHADNEAPIFFGKRKGRTILSKNLARSELASAKTIVGRYLVRFAEGAKKIFFSLELKDDALGLGDFFKVTTSRITDAVGAAVTRTYQVISRKRTGHGKIDLSAQESFRRRYGFIGPNTLPADYDSATTAEKEYAFIGDVENKVGTALDDGYYIF